MLCMEHFAYSEVLRIPVPNPDPAMSLGWDVVRLD